MYDQLKDKSLRDKAAQYDDVLHGIPFGAGGKIWDTYYAGLVNQQNQMDTDAATAKQKADTQAITDSTTDPAAQQRLNVFRQKGRASTMLTGPTGLSTSMSMSASRYLLGA